MLKLYTSSTSPFARRVRVVLLEKGVACEAIEGGLTDPDYGRINPNMQVPLLVDGEQTVFESNLIVEYLLAKFPGGNQTQQPPLATSLTRPEHHVRDGQVLAALELLGHALVILRQMDQHQVAPRDHKYVKRHLKRVGHQLDWLESQATDDGFIPGVFSVMDLNLVCTLQWVDFRKIVDWRPRPRLEAIMEKYKSRPSMVETAIAE